MNDSPQPPQRYFSGAYWLRSKFPVSELHEKRCLLRIQDGAFIREGVFTFDARTHGHFPDYHQISARHTVFYQTSGTTTVITFDQHRADKIERSRETDDYAFVVEIDIRRPLQYVSKIQDSVEKHFLERLKAIDARHRRNKP